MCTIKKKHVFLYVTAVLYLKVDADRKTKTVVPHFFLSFFFKVVNVLDMSSECFVLSTRKTTIKPSGLDPIAQWGD